MRQLILITALICCCAASAGAWHDCGPYCAERVTVCESCCQGTTVIHYSYPCPPPCYPPPYPYPYVYEERHYVHHYPPAGFNVAFGYSSGHGHGRGHGKHHGRGSGYSFSIGGFGIGRQVSRGRFIIGSIFKKQPNALVVVCIRLYFYAEFSHGVIIFISLNLEKSSWLQVYNKLTLLRSMVATNCKSKITCLVTLCCLRRAVVCSIIPGPA